MNIKSLQEIKQYYLNNEEELQKLKKDYFDYDLPDHAAFQHIFNKFRELETEGIKYCLEIEESIKETLNLHAVAIFNIDNKHYAPYSINENSPLGMTVLEVCSFFKNFLNKEDFVSFFNETEKLSDLNDFKSRNNITEISVCIKNLPKFSSVSESGIDEESLDIELTKYKFNIPYFSISILEDFSFFCKYFFKEEDALKELDFLKNNGPINISKLNDYKCLF